MAGDVLRALFALAFVPFVLGEGVCRLLADRHRRRMPPSAWTRAEVDKKFWGWLGTNVYVPGSQMYYMRRIRPRLDAEITDDAQSK